MVCRVTLGFCHNDALNYSLDAYMKSTCIVEIKVKPETATGSYGQISIFICSLIHSQSLPFALHKYKRHTTSKFFKSASKPMNTQTSITLAGFWIYSTILVMPSLTLK